MTLRFVELVPAIERNDVAAIVSHLLSASEAERRAINASVRALARDTWDVKGNHAAVAIAALGTAGGVRQDLVSGPTKP